MTGVGGMLLVGMLGVFLGQAPAVPTAQEVIGNVLKATVPDRPYTAVVTQTLAGGDGTTTKTRFTGAWSADKGFVINRDSVEVLEPRSDGKDEPGSDVQLGIDIAKYLKEMLKWPEVKVAADSRDGKSYWTLSGQDPRGTACQLWVDTSRWYVSQLTLDLQGRRYAEADFEYQQVMVSPSAPSDGGGGCWLLSKVVVKQVLDGTRITQEFEGYTLGHL